MQRDGVIGAAGIGIGILFFQARGDRTDLCARLFYIGPIFQAADETKEMRGAILDRVGDKRLERIKIFASHPDRIMKPRRHYADHRRWQSGHVLRSYIPGDADRSRVPGFVPVAADRGARVSVACVATCS